MRERAVGAGQAGECAVEAAREQGERTHQELRQAARPRRVADEPVVQADGEHLRRAEGRSHAAPVTIAGTPGFAARVVPGLVEELGKLAAADEMHAVIDAVLAGEAAQVAADRHAAVFERVGLDDKVVMLRMNRDFMEYMRTYYPEVIKSVHPKYGTVINADDVRQQREKTPSQSLICSEASKLFQDRLL